MMIERQECSSARCRAVGLSGRRASKQQQRTANSKQQQQRRRSQGVKVSHVAVASVASVNIWLQRCTDNLLPL